MPAEVAESLAPPPVEAVFGISLSRVTLINLSAQVGIVLSGGAVRLTGSGLGCPTFPSCTDEDFFPTPELEINGVIEFANRTLTGVVGVIALVTWYAVWRLRRRDLFLSAFGVLLGIVGQVLLGGVTVLTGLNPWTVAAHFLVSMALVATATRLHLRSREPALVRAPLTGPRRLLVTAIAADLGLALVLGTVTTGSGPHSGDPEAGRTGLDVAIMSRIHAESVYLLIGLTIVLILLTRNGPQAVNRAAWWVLAAEVVQGVIGITQYFTDLPRPLVSAHMLGAALLVVATARLWFLALSPLPGASRPDALARPEPGQGESAVGHANDSGR
jgi:cytochrome c oxidase assembly protein subunit 15